MLTLENDQFTWLGFFSPPKNLSKEVILHVKFKANLFNSDNIVSHYWEIEGNLSIRSCPQLRKKTCSGKPK